MAALASKKADIYITAGAAVTLTDEPMSDIAATFPANPATLARTTYAITNNVKRYFDPATPLVIERSLNSGGAWSTVVPDSTDAGVIQFVAQQQLSPVAMFRAHSGKYLPYSKLGGGYEWSIANAIDLIEVPEFGMTSKKHIVAQAGGSVQLKRWWADDSLRSLLGGLMVIVLYVDATAQPAAPRYEALCMLKADAIKAAAKGAIGEDVSFELQSDVNYVSG